MDVPDPIDCVAWAQLAPVVPPEWFVDPGRAPGLHGAKHIRRVYLLVLRLTVELGKSGPQPGMPQPDGRLGDLALHAALWHDLGRTHDGVEPGHGARSAERVLELGMTAHLPADDAALVLFAVRNHSLADDEGRDAAFATYHTATAGDGPEAALTVLWLLKDADALDRVRLAPGDGCDPGQLRYAASRELLPFATRLYACL